eukprot:g5811.t1
MSNANNQHRILYSSVSGKLYPLEKLLFCPNCRDGARIVSPSLQDSIVEIVSYYCPVILENYPSIDAASLNYRSSKAFECPECGNNLTIVTKGENNLFSFRCSYCRWSSSNPSGFCRYLSSCETGEEVKQLPSTLPSLTGDSYDDLVEKLMKMEKENNVTNAFQSLKKFYKEKRSKLSMKSSVQFSKKTGGSSSFISAHRNLPLGRASFNYGTRSWATGSSNSGRYKLKRNSQRNSSRNNRSMKGIWKVDDVEEWRKNINDNLAKPPKLDVPDIFEKGGKVNDKLESEKHLIAEKDISHLTCLHERLCYSLDQPIFRSKLFPQRKLLRVKCARRCRACVADGRPGILVQPEISPQHGDSSFRTSVGNWHKKQSLAWSYLPHLRIISFDNSMEEQAVILRLSNPTVFKSSPISGDYEVKFLPIENWIEAERQRLDEYSKLLDDFHLKNAEEKTVDNVESLETKKHEYRHRKKWLIDTVECLPKTNASLNLLSETVVLGAMEELPSLSLSKKKEKDSKEEASDDANADASVPAIVKKESTSVIIRLPLVESEHGKDSKLCASFVLHCVCEVPDTLNKAGKLEFAVPVHLLLNEV